MAHLPQKPPINWKPETHSQTRGVLSSHLKAITKKTNEDKEEDTSYCQFRYLGEVFTLAKGLGPSIFWVQTIVQDFLDSFFRCSVEDYTNASHRVIVAISFPKVDILLVVVQGDHLFHALLV